jgi:hypothetical protein
LLAGGCAPEVVQVVGQLLHLRRAHRILQ